MRFSIVLVSLALGLSTAGCVQSTQKITLNTAFEPSKAAYAKTPGNGKLEGQAFLRQVGGTVVTAAGEQVVLLPSVPYTDELMEKGGKFKGPYAPKLDIDFDPALKAYAKGTVADATGNFTFDRLSAGDYYLVTKVQWGVPSRYGVNTEGGDLIKRVHVAGSGVTKVIMTE